MDNEKFQTLVLQQLEQLNKGQSDLASRMDKNDSRLGNIETRLDRTDSRIDRIESRMDRMESRMDSMESRMDSMESKINSMDSKINSMDSRINKLELRIENEVVDKLRALFDDRELQNARISRMENDIKDISRDIHFLVSRVTVLEKAAK